MKLHPIFAVAALAFAGISYAGEKLGDGHSHSHKPRNGGIVVETKNFDLELVAKPDLIQLYVSDHGKTAPLEGAKAKVTLLSGAEKTDVELTLAGDKLEAKGNFKVARGTKAVAILTLAGKPPATARFEIK